MDLVSLGSLLASGASAVSGLMGAHSQEQAAKANQESARRAANSELAIGQKSAEAESRKATLAQSALMTQAAASGSGASDPTVMKLFGDIAGQGKYNSNMALADATTRSEAIKYQSALDSYRARAQAGATRFGAVGALAGGAMKGYGLMRSPMATKYGEPQLEEPASGWGSWETTWGRS